MKFSVVIPCHNAEPFIGQTLASVAAQTLAAHEVVVVNDRSSDDSDGVVKASDLPITLLHTDFGNAAAARNAGIDAATGDWIAFLDADDLWLPEHLANAREVLGGSSDIALHGHRQLMQDGRVSAEPIPWPHETPANGLPDDRFLVYFSDRMIFNTSSVVMDRATLIDQGKFNATFKRRHDMEMWLRVTKGRTWAYDPRATMIYRRDTMDSVSRENWASSELWHLRMLLECEPQYPTPAMHKLLGKAARRTLASAYTDGNADDRAAAWELAGPMLQPRDRWAFRAIGLAPGLFASMNRWRRGRLRSRAAATRRELT
ncbi:MAG: glycosyltransferase [Planctomycetota bacterium]